MSHFHARAHATTPASTEEFPSAPRWHHESCRWPSPHPALLACRLRPRLRLVAFTSPRFALTMTASSLCYRSSPLHAAHGRTACHHVAGVGPTHAWGDGGGGTGGGELGVVGGGQSTEWRWRRPVSGGEGQRGGGVKAGTATRSSRTTRARRGGAHGGGRQSRPLHMSHQQPLSTDRIGERKEYINFHSPLPHPTDTHHMRLLLRQRALSTCRMGFRLSWRWSCRADRLREH
jgi:hypothetical protein